MRELNKLLVAKGLTFNDGTKLETKVVRVVFGNIGKRAHIYARVLVNVREQAFDAKGFAKRLKAQGGVEAVRRQHKGLTPTQVKQQKVQTAEEAFKTVGSKPLTSAPKVDGSDYVLDNIRAKIIDMALEEPELSPRELAVRFTDTQSYYISEASVYRLLKAHDLITSPSFVVIKAANEFKDKPIRVNQQWQTDFTYFKIMGWGWYYLSTILDDYSRYVIAWKLCTTMKASDVTDTLNLALEASGCDSANVIHKPRLLSDNGASYVAGELADFLEENGMGHVRGAPYHPQTQGKIERWHQTLKNRVLLNNYYLPSQLEYEIGQFIEYYNHQRYHESINNLTPADVYFGRDKSILEKRRLIKNKTIKQRRLQHRKLVA